MADLRFFSITLVISNMPLCTLYKYMICYSMKLAKRITLQYKLAQKLAVNISIMWYHTCCCHYRLGFNVHTTWLVQTWTIFIISTLLLNIKVILEYSSHQLHSKLTTFNISIYTSVMTEEYRIHRTALGCSAFWDN